MTPNELKSTSRYFQICPTCGQFAWEWKVKPYPAMRMSVDMVIHKLSPQNGMIMSCQECKAIVPLVYLVDEFLKTILVRAPKSKTL